MTAKTKLLQRLSEGGKSLELKMIIRVPTPSKIRSKIFKYSVNSCLYIFQQILIGNPFIKIHQKTEPCIKNKLSTNKEKEIEIKAPVVRIHF